MGHTAREWQSWTRVLIKHTAPQIQDFLFLPLPASQGDPPSWREFQGGCWDDLGCSPGPEFPGIFAISFANSKVDCSLGVYYLI